MALSVVAAFLTDLIVGDPPRVPHPVVGIGKSIELLEKFLRIFIAPYTGLKSAGILLTLIIVGGSFFLTWSLLNIFGLIHPWLETVFQVWLISTTISARGLAEAGREIYDLLEKNNLSEARIKVGWIVGRDTDKMTEGEVVRAAVETIAENVVDGVVAPLFYAFIGGAPLAMAYRAVNTLDSMVGYKNEKYINFGYASARFDDLANLIPARLAGILMIVAALVSGRNPARAWRIMIRDATKHPSPNSGYTEAAAAGALSVRLGGLNYYCGVPSFRAYMGDDITPLDKGHIKDVIKIMYITSALAVILGAIATYIVMR